MNNFTYKRSIWCLWHLPLSFNMSMTFEADNDGGEKKVLPCGRETWKQVSNWFKIFLSPPHLLPSFSFFVMLLAGFWKEYVITDLGLHTNCNPKCQVTWLFCTEAIKWEISSSLHAKNLVNLSKSFIDHLTFVKCLNWLINY